MEKTQRMSTSIPISLHRRFKAWCAANGVVMNNVLREMLEQKLDQQDRGINTIKAAKTARGEARV